MQKSLINFNVVAILIGIGSSVTPVVLLTFGILQFKLVNIFGIKEATSAYALTAGIAGVTIVFLAPLSGMLIDKLSPRHNISLVLTPSLIGYAGVLGINYSENIYIIAAFWVLVKFSYGMVSGYFMSLIPKNISDNLFGRMSGLTGAITPLFIMIFSIIILGLYSGSSVEKKLLLLSNGQLVGAIVSCFFLLKIKTITEKIEASPVKKGYLYPSYRKYPEFTYALLTKLFISIITSGLSMTSLYYATRFNLSEKSVNEVNSICALGIIGMILSSIYFGALSDKLKKQKIFILISSSTIAISLFILSSTNNISMAIFASFLFQFSIGIW